MEGSFVYKRFCPLFSFCAVTLTCYGFLKEILCVWSLSEQGLVCIKRY